MINLKQFRIEQCYIDQFSQGFELETLTLAHFPEVNKGESAITRIRIY